MSVSIAHIFRHPIKAHGREPLASVLLSEGACLPFDRHWAVADAGAELPQPMAWTRCTNFSRGAKSAELMAISSTYDEATGRITLTHPDRPAITFDPETEAQAFLAWVGPLVARDKPQPVSITRAPGRGMTDSKFPSVALLNLASNRAVEQHLGQDLSLHRWRGNLWLDGLAPWAEFDLVGRDLKIGDAILHVEQPITRCRATSANPDTGKTDADTLGALSALTGARDFGIYATVTTGGEIAIGHPVEVLS